MPFKSDVSNNDSSNEKFPVILSFDVGVVHLSYCLMTKKYYKDKLDWHIIDWANIDLTDRDEMKCDCGKKASLTNMVNGVQKHYCKVHARKVDTTIKTFEECYKTIPTADIKCNYIVKEKECGKKAMYYPNDNMELHLCKVHGKAHYNNTNNACKMKSFHLKDSKQLNFDDVKYKLLMVLEGKPNLLTADCVVIENQPSFKNPRMKSIATTLYDYYLIRGVIDKATTKSHITGVRFMSPSNKLKLADSGDTKELVKAKSESTPGNDGKAYKLTKTLGIKYCTDLIAHLPDWLKHFNSHKKKDDLADSFLQGAYFYGTNYEPKKKPTKDEIKDTEEDVPKKDTKEDKPKQKKKKTVIEIIV